MIDDLEGRLAPHASMLAPAGETATLDGFVSAFAVNGDRLVPGAPDE